MERIFKLVVEVCWSFFWKFAETQIGNISSDANAMDEMTVTMSLPLFLSPTFTLHTPRQPCQQRTTPSSRGSSRKFTCLDCSWAISRAKLGRISGLGESIRQGQEQEELDTLGRSEWWLLYRWKNGTRIPYILIRFLHV